VIIVCEFFLKIQCFFFVLVLGELLATLAGLGDVLQDVVADGLGERAALADDDLVADLGLEGGRAVHGEVLVALHVALVLLHVVEVVAADDNGALGARRVHDAAHQAAADRHVAGEGALLVDVLAGDGGLGRAEAEADRLPVAQAAERVDVLLGLLARVLVHASLLLVGALALDRDVVRGGLVVLAFSLSDHFFVVGWFDFP
jgi:hypothetical protein